MLFGNKLHIFWITFIVLSLSRVCLSHSANEKLMCYVCDDCAAITESTPLKECNVNYFQMTTEAADGDEIVATVIPLSIGTTTPSQTFATDSTPIKYDSVTNTEDVITEITTESISIIPPTTNSTILKDLKTTTTTTTTIIIESNSTNNIHTTPTPSILEIQVPVTATTITTPTNKVVLLTNTTTEANENYTTRETITTTTTTNVDTTTPTTTTKLKPIAPINPELVIHPSLIPDTIATVQHITPNNSINVNQSKGEGEERNAQQNDTTSIEPAATTISATNKNYTPSNEFRIRQIRHTPTVSYHCFKLQTNVNGSIITKRGCSLANHTPQSVCEQWQRVHSNADISKCEACSQSQCNGSSTSTVSLTAIVFALLVAAFLQKNLL